MQNVPETILTELQRYRQEHVLRWWPSLNSREQQQLIEQLRAVDLKQIHDLFHDRERLESVPPLESVRPIQASDLSKEASSRWKSIGEDLIRSGKVAVLVVAGGQGTRLGMNEPKGVYPVGPVSGKSLFQIHAEKVLALRKRYRASVPLLVMTSPATDAATRDYFEQKNFFGLPSEEVHFFCQGAMPAVDQATGKLLMEERHRIFTSPNGHGGVLLALETSGLLEQLRAGGIEQVYYFQVDNPLTQIADPAFLGHHVAAEAEASSKVVPKRNPTDKLGNLVQVEGRCRIIEYSDLPDHLAEARDERGELRFGIGSPAIHVFSVEFLYRVLQQADSLPFHPARKKVPFIDESGERIVPAETNAFKFEMFIFDILPHAERWTAVATTYEDEFAPLKNAAGPDSPETVRKALSDQAKRWLEWAGMPTAHAADEYDVEIDPLFALDAEQLKHRLNNEIRISGHTYVSDSAAKPSFI